MYNKTESLQLSHLSDLLGSFLVSSASCLQQSCLKAKVCLHTYLWSHFKLFTPNLLDRPFCPAGTVWEVAALSQNKVVLSKNRITPVTRG